MTFGTFWPSAPTVGVTLAITGGGASFAIAGGGTATVANVVVSDEIFVLVSGVYVRAGHIATLNEDLTGTFVRAYAGGDLAATQNFYVARSGSARSLPLAAARAAGAALSALSATASFGTFYQVDETRTAVPGSPTEGQSFLLLPPGTGGAANSIYRRLGGVWQVFEPSGRSLVLATSPGALYSWSGSAWVTPSQGPQGLPGLTGATGAPGPVGPPPPDIFQAAQTIQFSNAI